MDARGGLGTHHCSVVTPWAAQVRSYLYVEDVAEAFDCVLHRGTTGEVRPGWSPFLGEGSALLGASMPALSR